MGRSFTMGLVVAAMACAGLTGASDAPQVRPARWWVDQVEGRHALLGVEAPRHRAWQVQTSPAAEGHGTDPALAGRIRRLQERLASRSARFPQPRRSRHGRAKT